MSLGIGISLSSTSVIDKFKSLIRKFWRIYYSAAPDVTLLDEIDEAMLLALLNAVYPQYITLMLYAQYLDEDLTELEIDAEIDDELGAVVLDYINDKEEE